MEWLVKIAVKIVRIVAVAVVAVTGRLMAFGWQQLVGGGQLEWWQWGD